MSSQSEKPRTRAELQAEIVDLHGRLTQARETHDVIRRERQAAVDREKSTREEFADLKQRLAIAETDNARMRGYIERVQEDDVVREDLVKVGDPDGAEHLVPKRKPTLFKVHSPFAKGLNSILYGDTSESFAMTAGRERSPPPKHWVNY